MRNTIDNDDPGQVDSRLSLKSWPGDGSTQLRGTADDAPVAGFRPFPGRGLVITNDEIQVLRDSEGI